MPAYQDQGLLDFISNRIVPLEQRHLLSFLLTSFLTTCIGFSLCFSRKYGKTYSNIHAIPVFFAPILFSKIMTDYLSLSWGSMIRGNDLLLPLFGMLFHSWLAAFLFQQFDFDKRISDIKFLLQTAQYSKAPNAPILEVAILRLVKPFLVVWVVTFLFFESMVAAPSFLDTGNWSVLYSLNVYANSASLEPFLKFRLSLLIVAGFSVAIASTYLIAVLIERLMERRIRKHALFVSKGKWLVKNAASIIKSLVYPSSLLFTVVSFIVLKTISGTISKQSAGGNPQVLEILSTFFSDALTIGVIVIAVLSAIIYYRLAKNRHLMTPKLEMFVLIGAVAPPVIYGVIGLSVSFNRLALDIAGIAASALYSFCLLLFLIPWYRLKAEMILFVNASHSSQSFLNRVKLAVCSSYFLIISSILLALYFIWIEDGIQYLLSRNENYLAAKIRGFQRSRLSDGVVFGLVASCGLLFILAGIIQFVNRTRFKIIRIKYLKMVIAFFLLSHTTYKAYSQEIHSSNLKRIYSNTAGNYNIIDKQVIISPSKQSCSIGTINFQGQNCIVYLETDSTCSISIDKLSFTGNSTVTFRPLHNPIIKEILVKSTEVEGVVTPIVKFSGFQIGNLSFEGRASTPSTAGIDLICDETCTLDKLMLSNIRLPHVSADLSRNSSVRMTNVQINEVQLTLNKSYDINASAVSIFCDKVSFYTDNLNQESKFRLRRMNVSDMHLHFNGLATKSNFTLALENCSLNGLNTKENPSESVIEVEDLQTTIDISNMRLESKLTYTIQHIATISLSNIQNESNLLAGIDFNIQDALQPQVKVALFNVDVSALKICMPNSEIKVDASMNFVKVRGVFELSRNIVESMNTLKRPSFERNSFFAMLQSNGKVCPDGDDVGKDALYLKKKVDMNGVSPFLSFLIDRLTGYGIHPVKALWSFLIYALITCLILFYTISSPPSGTKNRHLTKLKEVLQVLVISDKRQSLSVASITTIYIFHLILFIQLTLLSIYLGQITLQ